MNSDDKLNELYSNMNLTSEDWDEENITGLIIHENDILSLNKIEGLEIDVDRKKDINVNLKILENVEIKKPVHLCFGILSERGSQKINLNIDVGKSSKIKIISHCIFPYATDVEHFMDAKIWIRDYADCSYIEEHIHSEMDGIKVIPHAEVEVNKNSRFKAEFKLVKGNVGTFDLDYQIRIKEYGLADITSKIKGKGNDNIKISESSVLEGRYSKSILTSKIAVCDNAKSDIYNKITALAPYSRGHIDCKEIVQDDGIANATPIIDLRNSKANITHEAFVGNVDKKQLETLMSRGLNENEANDLIIQGLLS